jgi:hypothetical protein
VVELPDGKLFKLKNPNGRVVEMPNSAVVEMLDGQVVEVSSIHFSVDIFSSAAEKFSEAPLHMA